MHFAGVVLTTRAPRVLFLLFLLQKPKMNITRFFPCPGQKKNPIIYMDKSQQKKQICRVGHVLISHQLFFCRTID
jgi:hypothetical protein